MFIGGGIAPKILPALTDGRFKTAFKDKGAMRSLVENVPVKIILNANAGLAQIRRAGALRDIAKAALRLAGA